MNSCQINIAILEPSQIICEGLSNILIKLHDHTHIYHFDSIKEVFEGIHEYNINLVIINPSFIYKNKNKFIQKKDLFRDVSWIGFLYSVFEREIIDLFDDTIQITDSPEEINAVMHKLDKSPCLHKNEMGPGKLTKRELEVLKQIALGLSNKEIADTLNISIHTVVSHRKNIIRKTEIKSQAGLTIYAISNKIITIDNYNS